MGLNINLSSMANQKLQDEINTFSEKDDEFREQLIKGGKIIGINPQMGRVSISLNNNVNMFLSSCRSNGILYPLKEIIAYDLCVYLEHLYYTELSDSVDNINDLISDYLERNSVIRLLNSNTYYRDLSQAYRSQIISYNRVVNDMYSFDINKDGNRIIEYLLSTSSDMHEVISSHRAYHERLNNKEVLEYIEKIK